MSMAGSDITVEILKDIRNEIRATNTRLDELRADTNRQFDGVRGEIRELRTDTNQRFVGVETALLDLAEQHRFVVRYARAMSGRHVRLEPRVSKLEKRVDKLERK
jgi:hypothetical protein